MSTAEPMQQSAHEVMESLRILPAAAEKPKKPSLLGALDEVKIDGDFAEFGVFKGKSARHILGHMTGNRKLHLFDSFEGLPEDWTRGKPQGAFAIATEEIPAFDDERVVIHKGWFKDTVPPWGKQATTQLAFIHMDADLYSSTVEAFFNTNHLIKPGTIVLFDEYARGNDHKSDQEHRALLDWAAKFNRKYEYLWRSCGPQVCIRITK